MHHSFQSNQGWQYGKTRPVKTTLEKPGKTKYLFYESTVKQISWL